MSPELDEETAVFVVAILNNHIANLQSWVRKVKQPYLPYAATHAMYTHPSKPTLQTLLHIITEHTAARDSLLRVAQKVNGQDVRSREAG